MATDEDFEEEFWPDDFLIEGTETGQVRLVWQRDSGERRVVVLERRQLPAVLDEIQRQTEHASVASTDVLALLSETDARVTGLGFERGKDHFRLSAFVDLPTQEMAVSISLLLFEPDLEQCVSAMTHWLKRQAGKG